MAVSTVLWDWNGTLINDVPLCFDILNRLLTRHGYAPVQNVAAYKNIFCFPIEEYYRRAGFRFEQFPFAQLADEYIEMYVPESMHCPLQPGAVETLQKLQQQGKRQIILSASRTDILEQQLCTLGVRQYFDTVLGIADIYAHSKVEIGRQWINTSGTDKAGVVMLGDCEHDHEVAGAMGVQCVLFSGGHQPKALLQTHCVPVIENLADFPLLINEV